jgi:hypothetical protein
VKLSHAIKVAEGIAARDDMAAEEAVAIRVLIEMGRRVTASRPSLRAIVRAVYGEDLNQADMAALFSDPDSG